MKKTSLSEPYEPTDDEADVAEMVAEHDASLRILNKLVVIYIIYSS